MKELHEVKIYHLGVQNCVQAGQSNGHKSVDASTLKAYVTLRF